MKRTSPFFLGIAALIVFASVGCQTTNKLSNRPRDKSASLLDRLPFVNKDKDDEEPYPNPVKVASTWTPDTLVQTGRVPTRGFGGRIFFYDEKSRPVPVDGTLIVHGFDEKAADPKQSVKRFEFTPEQFTKHFSKSDLGASYSIWIPWDAMGGEQKKVSLVTSFKTKEGRMVQGSPTTMMLPGAPEDTSEESFAKKLSPEFQKYKDALANAGATRPSGLTTTTIARRRIPAVERKQPNLISPEERKSMLAAGAPTPSLEISPNKRPGAAGILPASANVSTSENRNAVKQSFMR